MNGDGFDDLIIGASYADPNGRSSGKSYVVFGSNAGFDAAIELDSLDGRNGFVLNGIDADDHSGRSVSSAGDVNGDGFDDLIIGAYRADPNGSSSGESYVVFGSDAGFDAAIELDSLDGRNGFALNGIDAGDSSGISVSGAGDINGDGFDDLIIGASSADPNGSSSGESYVVFGSDAGFDAAIELDSLDGRNGFVLTGADAGDVSGHSVSSAGDVNGDGIDDLIIGASYTVPNGVSSGESYVVFGSNAGFDAAIELDSLDRRNGFVLNGMETPAFNGRSVVSDAGDINGDGFDDLIIGSAYYSSQLGDNYDGYATVSDGRSYVVFGSGAGFDTVINLSSLDGSNGFVVAANKGAGYSVSSAGDFNGDGFDDLIIGQYAGFKGRRYSGESYVVFGSSAGFDAAIELDSLDGRNGFVLTSTDEYNSAGYSVSGAGDVNGDGFDDLIIGTSYIIGTYGADPSDSYSGKSYVVFGFASDKALPTAANDAIIAVPG